MNNQILISIPFAEFETMQKTWIKDVLTEINNQSAPPPQTRKEIYGTRKEVAKELKISLVTLNEFTKKGIIQGYRISGRVLYKWTEIYSAVKEMRTEKYRRG